MARNTISDFFSKLRPHVNANKKKGKLCINILQAIDKYLDRAYYKRFFQMNEVIGSDKFF